MVGSVGGKVACGSLLHGTQRSTARVGRRSGLQSISKTEHCYGRILRKTRAKCLTFRPVRRRRGHLTALHNLVEMATWHSLLLLFSHCALLEGSTGTYASGML